MRSWTFGLFWVVAVLIGAAAGFLIGYAVWKLGFEFIGSAIAMVGAAGGIVVFVIALDHLLGVRSRRTSQLW